MRKLKSNKASRKLAKLQVRLTLDMALLFIFILYIAHYYLRAIFPKLLYCSWILVHRASDWHVILCLVGGFDMVIKKCFNGIALCPCYSSKKESDG